MTRMAIYLVPVEMNHEHRRASPGLFVMKAAPVLEFDLVAR